MARTISPDVSVADAPLNGHLVSAPRPAALNLLISLRPGQWTKNLFVFAALVFAQKLFDPTAVIITFAAFCIFCVLSGVVYLVNDVADRDSDRQHPLKKHRPIAAGALSVSAALGSAAILGTAALLAAFAIGFRFGLIASGYLALLVAYSGPLKHIVILDVLTIAIGFVLRAAGGAVALDVETSKWLFVCTILLSLFIALAKRRHELVLLA